MFVPRPLLFASCAGRCAPTGSTSSLHGLRSTTSLPGASSPSDSVATASPSVRKRLRPRAVEPSSSSSSAPRPPRGSVPAIDAAISAGALVLLPEIVARDLESLSYGAILRVVSALIKGEQWHAVVAVYESAVSCEGLRVRFTTRLYTDLFFALMKAGGISDGRKAYDEWAMLVDERLDVKLMGPRAYNFLFVLLSRLSLVDEALDVRANCTDNGFYLNRYSYNAFLNACAKSHRIADAFETLREMAESNVRPDVVSFNVLIACCVRSGDLDIALGILHRMKDWGINPDIYSYNSVVNGLRKNKMLEEAFQLVAQMERDASNGTDVPLVTDISKRTGSKRDNATDHTQVADSTRGSTAAPLIQALTTARRASFSNVHPERNLDANVEEKDEEGREAEEADAGSVDVEGKSQGIEMDRDVKDERSDNGVTGVGPDLVTYNTLISGLAGMDHPDFQRAMGVKKHMESRGVVCNEVSYNALMAVAARANKIQAAFDIYDEMISRSLKPNCECFTTLVTLCGRANMIDRAFQIHDQMMASGIRPSVITFNALLTACRCTADRDSGEAALRVLKVMRETPGCTPDVITYSTVIDALGRGGRFSQVREVLDEMSREGVEPNLVTYTSVISALTRAGDLDGAMRVLQDMEDHGIKPNVYTFSSLIHGAGRQGDFRKAFGMLRMMRERGILASRVTYSMLLQLAVKSGERELLDHVVDVLVTDSRLKGTPQLERIVKLSESPDVFVEGRNKKIFGMMNAAVEQCIAVHKPRGADRTDRSIRRH